MSTALLAQRVELPDEQDVEAAVLSPLRPDNPACIGFPPLLPFELAMRTSAPAKVCEAYGISREEFAVLCDDPIFQQAFAAAVEGLRKEGASFRVKARLQAEELLKKSWAIIHAAETPPSVQADLIKHTVRWAGYEPRGEEGSKQANAFQININLG